MANENDSEIDDTKSLGVDPAQFEIVVAPLRGLRDEGKYTVFLTRSGSVRIVGAIHDLEQSLSKEPETFDAKKMGKALAEVGNYCQAAVFFKNTKGVVNFLEENIYDEAFEDKTEEQKAALREHLQNKTELARDLLPSDIKQRRKRLQTATDACLEDVDVEIVRERRDECVEATVANSFLRLRIRYTDSHGELFPWFFSSGPWGSRPATYKSFSLECDPVDIDVLLFRLTGAKQRLATEIEK